MQFLGSFLPVWIVMFPMVMTVVIYYVEQRSEKMRNALAVATSVVTFLSVLALYPGVMAGKIIEFELFQILPNLAVSFRVDILSFSLALLSSFIWMLVAIYSIDYMCKEHGCNRYYPVLIITLASCMGIFMAGDLFTLFVFFEMMSLISYVLVVHEETIEALRAGYKYLIMTIIGGLALFFGIIITFELGGSVSLSNPVPLISEPSTLAFFAFISFLIGFGMKAGMFPLHVWLPDAHPVAPSPASALLSGIMLKTGAYGLLRVIFHVYGIEFMQETGWTVILAVVAVITILLGSAVAITQDNLKRRLAYSSVGQMGYILLGISILNERALMGNIFHIFSHAFMKSTLFLAAGAIILKTGKKNIKDLGGIGRQMPFTMFAFTLAALSMIGIPPFNGFLSKWTLSLGAMDAGVPFYVLILLISSLLNGLYYLPIIIAAFFGEEQGEGHKHEFVKINEAPYKMLIPIAILAVSCLLFGLLPSNLPFDLSRVAAEYLLRGGF
ncbi:MAG: monovalent cation/H+ antiporter subunit D family protein [Dethiobacter sp.]|jgi:multicomponent Na+:H+ antiporter subunit D|nr:monovalent cation/H+ antiporter subunit D family protein [Dethiobacter sp.]MBS3901170.1 monovalent cation/H+ antiporter subunit D family protein [Dethiobacter sp.]MBS3989138.1 monovalent cation/H+ antiporter subunit D family protein [Dethiobacter sp.]